MVSGSWESLESQRALGVAVTVTYFNSQWGWTCVYGWTLSSHCEALAFLRPAQPQGHSLVWWDFWAPDFQKRRERDRGGLQPMEEQQPTGNDDEAGLWVCSLDQMVFTGPVSSSPAVFIRGSKSAGGAASRALDSCGDMPCRPPDRFAQCLGLWHPQLECLHQKTAGTEGNSSYPSWVPHFCHIFQWVLKDDPMSWGAVLPLRPLQF